MVWNTENWREESGYEGDPTKLQIGTVVGKKDKPKEFIENEATSIPIQLSETIEGKIDHHIRDGIIETLTGVLIIAGGLYATCRTVTKNPTAATDVGYSSITVGGTIIALGIARLTGNNNNVFLDEVKMVVEPALAAALKDVNKTSNRSEGNTIDFKRKEDE